MPAEAAPEKMRMQHPRDFPNPEDRPRILEDNEQLDCAALIAGIDRLDAGLGAIYQILHVSCLLLVLQLRHIKNQRLFSRPVVPEMHREIVQVQRQRIPVEQVISIGKRQPGNALDRL